MPDFTDLAAKLKKYLFSSGTLDQQANGTQTQQQTAAPPTTNPNATKEAADRNEEFVRQKRLRDAMAAKATTGQKK